MKRRVGVDTIFIAQFRPFTFFHVDFRVDEILIEKSRDRWIGKDIGSHPFTWHTPACVGIEKDEFVGLLGFRKGSLPVAVGEFHFTCLAECA